MIDMSDISSMYSDIYTSAANQSANKLKDKLQNADLTGASDDELMAACKQFEAYFVEQLYKGMLKTIPQSENTSNYTSSMMDFYKDQMVQSVAEMTTEQNNLGLAQMLYEQLKRNYSAVEIPGREANNDIQDTAGDAEEIDAAATI